LGEDANLLRSLIREEVSQGLRGFRSELQQTLRNVLHEDSKPMSSKLPASTSLSSGNTDALRQTAAEKPPDMLLAIPGTVQEYQDRPKSREKATKIKCSCGNTFLDDAVYCRKCGAPRPNACTFCGNIMKDDADFCRKCGKSKAEIDADKAALAAKAEAGGDMPLRTQSTVGKAKKKKKQTVFQSDDQKEELTQLQRLTKHRGYEVFSGTLIVLNSFFLGYQTQYMASEAIDNAEKGLPLGDPPGFFFFFQLLFAFCFFWELTLRWKAEGFTHFFSGEDIWWNALDVMVVSTSCIEVLLEIVAKASGTEKSEALQNISIIRVLRIVRIVRVARVIRVMRFFRELRMMIFSILGSLKNLMWVMLVLLMTFYMFGVLFTTAASDFLDTSEKWQEHLESDLVLSFGKIDRSLLSLFMSMTGGNDWSMYYDSLSELPMYCSFAFLVFIAFSLFAVVNIVTGVFVESALQANVKDKDILVHEELHSKQTYLESMQEIFEEMDESGEGNITLAEFEAKLQDERVQAYFNVLKLDVSDAKVLFHLLDHDHSDEVGVDEFLEGCYKLQGESRSLDMKIMQSEVHFLQEHFWDFDKELKSIRKLLFQLVSLTSPDMVVSPQNGESKRLPWHAPKAKAVPGKVPDDEVEDV
jgi:hypothetical protein